jgi:hypothetical protein
LRVEWGPENYIYGDNNPLKWIPHLPSTHQFTEATNTSKQSNHPYAQSSLCLQSKLAIKLHTSTRTYHSNPYSNSQLTAQQPHTTVKMLGSPYSTRVHYIVHQSGGYDFSYLDSPEYAAARAARDAQKAEEKRLRRESRMSKASDRRSMQSTPSTTSSTSGSRRSRYLGVFGGVFGMLGAYHEAASINASAAQSQVSSERSSLIDERVTSRRHAVFSEKI